ncbi:MAG TPA: glycosyltransferase [Gemmataceae bacterium]|nr:glycosyltransferase [Gemmataceae bacterium]
MPIALPTVAHLLHTLNVGGAEVLAARLGRRLRDDFRFVFFCLEQLGTLGEQLRGEGFQVHVIGRRPGLDFGCCWRLSRRMRGAGVDLLHAHQYTPFFYGITARQFYRRPPVLFTEHGRTFPDYRRPRRVLANRALLARRDRVVAVGDAVRRALIDHEGIPAARAGVIYNGIALPSGTATADDRAAARRAMGVGPDDFVLLQVARLDPLKDHATAVRAVAGVAQRRPDVRLVLVGEGPDFPAIQELVGKRQLDSVVRLLGLRTDVPRLWAGADAALLTSVSEGIPLTLLEAMAARLPVVSTNVGGVPEVVEDGRTGLLAAAGDDEGLARQILRLAEDSELRRAMGEAGRCRAEERFDEARMLGAYRRLYHEMLGQ